MPTTLLAQVDSAVGGKTGVIHTGREESVGAFHQPICVLSDTRTVQAAARELRAGLAEVIKYGLIEDDATFFQWIDGTLDKLLARDPAALVRAIRRSCEIKARMSRR